MPISKTLSTKKKRERNHKQNRKLKKKGDMAINIDTLLNYMQVALHFAEKSKLRSVMYKSS